MRDRDTDEKLEMKYLNTYLIIIYNILHTRILILCLICTFKLIAYHWNMFKGSECQTCLPQLNYTFPNNFWL